MIIHLMILEKPYNQSMIVELNIEGQKIQTLKKNLSQNEKIIRYLFIKVNKHAELPTKLLAGNE